MNHGIPESAVKCIRDVLRGYPQVVQAILYGSRAKGTHQHGSDIDMVLRGDADLTLEVLGGILVDLDEQYLPYTFDISIYANIAEPDLVAHIGRVGFVLYEKNKGAFTQVGKSADAALKNNLTALTALLALFKRILL